MNIARSEAQRHAALSRYNPQVNMFLATGWDTGITYMGQNAPHTPVARVNVSIPIFRWGARFKTNRQQKAYIGIQKLQQSYVTDNILRNSAATTKLTETEQQVKTAKENMTLAEENLDLVTFSYNEGKASMVDVLSAQLSWTQAHTNLINAYLAEKMAVAEYWKVVIQDDTPLNENNKENSVHSFTKPFLSFIFFPTDQVYPKNEINTPAATADPITPEILLDIQ